MSVTGTRESLPAEQPQLADSIGASVTAWGLLTAAGTVVAVSSLLGFLGSYWWFFDLFSHFRVQYSIALTILALALLAGRKWSIAVTFTVIAALNIATVLPLYLDSRQPASSPRPTRAMLLNVDVTSQAYTKVDDAIRHYDPDVLVLLEINRAWLKALETLQTGFPHRVTQPREDYFGIGLFSKIPIDQAHVFAIGSPEIPAIRAELALKSRRVTIVGVHIVPPKGATMSRLRNHQLAELSAMVSNDSPTTLLLGDLNVTPWSAQFHRLQESSSLQRCSLGRGVQPTWPADIPIFLIPIDHCLHADGITILNNEIGSSVGSDHYPVIVDFVPTSE